jgi:Flp pilus assembly protein TadG
MRTLRRAILPFVGRLGNSRSAAAAVEMAFIGPILVFLAAGMIDFGLGAYTKMMVSDAAQAGAAYAQLNAGNYNSTPCTSNTGPVCAWDQNVQTAATYAHPSGTPFSTAPTATAAVYYCCISGGAVTPVGSCTQPPSAPPTCTPATPSAGTYVQIVATSQLTTLLPYNLVSSLFNFGVNIPNPLTLQSSYLVRIQ